MLWCVAVVWLGCTGVAKGVLLRGVADHTRDEEAQLAKQVSDRTNLQPRKSDEAVWGRCRGGVCEVRRRVQRGCRGGCAHRGVDAERVEAWQVGGGAEGKGYGIRHLGTWGCSMGP